jgi:hypothetical protein
MEKLNLETELQRALQSVDYKLMLKKCKKYKVKINGTENLAELCIKYLNKKSKMKDWEFSPKDFLNPDDIIEDIVAEIIVMKKYKIKKVNKNTRQLKKVLELFINIYELNYLFDYYKTQLIEN